MKSAKVVCSKLRANEVLLYSQGKVSRGHAFGYLKAINDVERLIDEHIFSYSDTRLCGKGKGRLQGDAHK